MIDSFRAWSGIAAGLRHARAWRLALLGLPLVACAAPAGTLLIVQNQQPTVDSTTGQCVISTDSTAASLASGVFDVDLDRPYPYYVYPLVENRFPSIITSGGVERNSLLLRQILTSIKAPAGVDPGWAAGCPGDFSSPASGQIEPGAARAVRVQGFQSCHAQRLRALIAAGAIPADTAQPVFFTLQLTAIADGSGSQQTSPVFPFDVQVCAGCLQSMFPLVPSCANAPKPNLLHGNPCNIAQDGPPVLCCTDPSGALICPAPDM